MRKIADYLDQVRILLSSRVAQSVGLITIGNIVTAGIGFICSILVLRHFSDSSIALIYSLIGIMHIFNQLGDLGLSNSFVKLAASCEQEDGQQFNSYCTAALKIKMFGAIFLLIVGLLISGPLCVWIFGSVKDLFWVRSIMAVSSIGVFFHYATLLLQVQRKFKLLALNKILSNLTKLSILIYAVYSQNLSFSLLFCAFISVIVAQSLLNWFVLDKKELTLNNRVTPEVKKIFSFSIWIFFSSLISSVIGQIDIFMVQAMSNASEVSRLVGGHRLSAIFTIVTHSLSVVLLPKVSAMNSREEMVYYMRKVGLLFPICAIFILAMLFFSPTIIEFLLGTKYQSSVLIFNTYSLGLLMSVLISPISIVMFKLNREKSLFYMNFFQLILNIFLNFILIPNWGAAGAALSSLAIRVFSLFIILYLIKKYMPHFSKENT